MLLCHLIFLIFFFIYKIETVKIRPNFDEIFGEEWDINEREEKDIKIVQNENSKQFTKQIVGENDDPNDQQKRELIQKFEIIKEKLREKRTIQNNYRNKIELKIGKLLGTNRHKIYKWKKELNLNKKKNMKKNFYEQKKKEFIERFDEFKSLFGQGKQKEFVKELGICERTFLKWKKEIMPTKYHKTQKTHSSEEKLRKMKQYLKIKERNSKFSNKKIAKELGIASVTLFRWKKKLASISNP